MQEMAQGNMRFADQHHYPSNFFMQRKSAPNIHSFHNSSFNPLANQKRHSFQEGIPYINDQVIIFWNLFSIYNDNLYFRLTLEVILFGAMLTIMSWCLRPSVSLFNHQQESLSPVKMRQSMMKWMITWKIFAKQSQSKLWTDNVFHKCNLIPHLYIFNPSG